MKREKMKLKMFAYFVAGVIILILSPLFILIFLNAFIPHPKRTIRGVKEDLGKRI